MARPYLLIVETADEVWT